MGDNCPHCGVELPAIRDAFCPECRNDLDEAPSGIPHPPNVEVGDGAIQSTGDPVWYATEARVFRWLKLRGYDDRGTIYTTPEGCRFVGRKGVVRMDRVDVAERIGPVNPWGTVVSLVIGDALVLVAAWAGVFNYLTLENPITYVFLGLMNLFVLASWPWTWVKVEYTDERGQSHWVYFVPQSVIARWTGATERLFAVMQQAARKHKEGTESPFDRNA